jgi:hypothetical protein
MRIRPRSRLAGALLAAVCAVGVNLVVASPAQAIPTGCTVENVRPLNWAARGRCTGGSGRYQVFAYCVSKFHGTYLAQSPVDRPPNWTSATCDGYTTHIATSWITTWS